MEEKYYTPNISEFCQGFEYEMKSTFGDGTIKNKIQYDSMPWEKYVFSIDQFPYVERSLLGTNAKNGICGIRVKCLNQKHIEGLGWGHDFNNDGEEFPALFDEHGYSLGFSIDNQLSPSKALFLLYYFPDNFLIIERVVNCGSGREDMLFRGYIKNKSELSKLMSQLLIK